MNPGKPKVDLTGERFGRLVALRIHSKGKKGFLWECVCDCGTFRLATVHALRNDTKSCGCLHREAMQMGREAMVKRNTKPLGEASFEGVYRGYKNSAIARNLEFSLSREEVRRVTSMPCSYCGVPPLQGFRNGKNNNGDYLHNGIDRLDPSFGYTPGNCCPCCTVCNFAKGSMPLPMFLDWVERLTTFRNAVPIEESLALIVVDQLHNERSPDNEEALKHFEAGLHFLQKRTKDRLARGVEGTNVK